jgi:hypothetical protein
MAIISELTEAALRFNARPDGLFCRSLSTFGAESERKNGKNVQFQVGEQERRKEKIV